MNRQLYLIIDPKKLIIYVVTTGHLKCIEVYGEAVRNSCHVQSTPLEPYESLDLRSMERNIYTCALLKENWPSGWKEPRQIYTFSSKTLFVEKNSVFYSQPTLGRPWQAFEIGVVASSPSTSCLPTLLNDASIPTHPTHLYRVEPPLDVSRHYSRSASGF